MMGKLKGDKEYADPSFDKKLDVKLTSLKQF